MVVIVGLLTFYSTTDCSGDIFDGPKCENYVRAAHRSFTNHYGLSAEEVPLLQLDLWNWQEPFSLDAKADPAAAAG